MDTTNQTNSLLDTLGSLVKTGTGVYNTVTGHGSAPAASGGGGGSAPAPAAVSSGSSLTKYLPWAIGGLVLLVVGVLLVRK